MDDKQYRGTVENVIHQALAEERERMRGEISKIRIEMDSRKTFNCVKKTDVHGFCCDAHLGEADADTKWGQALSSLDTDNLKK